MTEQKRKSEPYRDREWFTFKLWAADRTLLQTLADRQTKTEDRYSALLAMIPFARNLEIEDIRNRERQSLRIGIPRVLHDEILRIKKETGQSLTAIILAIAHDYTEQYPLLSNEGEDEVEEESAPSVDAT